MTTERAGRELPDGLELRHPTEAEHLHLWRCAKDWGERRDRGILPRRWIRDFGPTSWVADLNGTPVGILIGYPSPGRPSEAVVLLVATEPSLRRRGIGRALVTRFAAQAAGSARETVRMVIWPGDPPAIRFLRGVGFNPSEEPGGQRLYGTPALADYDGEGEDRAVFVLDVPGA